MKRLDGVSFERLISHKPVLLHGLAFDQPSLRDMVFEHYSMKFRHDDRRSLEATTEYLDAIHDKFGPTP